MRNYPANLKAVGGARTGIAPANLLDIEDVNGNLYFFADREISAPTAILGSVAVPAAPPVPIPAGMQIAWTLPAKVILGPYGAGGALPIGSLSGGYLYMMGSGGGAGGGTELQWEGFTLPPLPGDAVIEAAYAVVMATGTGQVPNTASGAYIILPGVELNAGAFSGQYNGNIGNPLGTPPAPTIAEIESAVIVVQMQAPPNQTFFQDVTVTFVGVAVYFSSASAPGGGAFSVTTPNFVTRYKPWLLGVPEITYNRSLQTDIGSFQIQNLSGTSLSRDTSAILRKSALEGALFVYRCWQPDAQAAWIEVHGTLTVEDVPPDILRLKGVQAINPAQDDTPLEQYSETCQWNWGLARCGSTQATECLYSYQSCQVLERIAVVMNNYEKNYGETVANTPLVVINRARKV